MGSKSPDGEDRGHDGIPSNSFESPGSGGEPRGCHTSRDGDGCLGDGGGDDDDDDDGGAAETTQDPVNCLEAGERAGNVSNVKKPKRKSRKKKKKAPETASPQAKQSSTAKMSVDRLFPSGDFPLGEIQGYQSRLTAAAETRSDDFRCWNDETFLQDYRKAAEVHRQARRWARDHVKPGYKLLDIACGIEDRVRTALGHTGIEPGESLKSGMGFPTGLCLNHQTAHYTPNPGQKDVVLQYQDVMKVDFGVHVNGWIIDSAFTMSFDPVYDTLLTAVKEATNEGIKATGIDVRISDISAAIHETMESFEVEIGGKTCRVKPVRNITAHNIKQWRIHGGKSIPFVKNSDQTKLEEGEVIAIETFGTTGSGYLRDDVGIYGYGLKHDAPLKVPLPLTSAERLHKTIRENFGTLVFCRRYLDRLGLDRYLAGLNCLVSHGILETHEPLMDIKGSYTAQFEHTLLLRETHKEVLSRGDDY